jgi:cation diffusion facilitator CzcD-associated flavoprotein CzcO
VLERGEGPGAKWRSSYDGLRINTSAWYSYLPGLRIKASRQWPERDELVKYYERYVDRFDIPLQPNCEAQRIEQLGDKWLVRTNQGELEAAVVVVATAKDHTPLIPDWPGRATYTGEVLHSAQFRNPRPYVGRNVLVVGAGNSGFDIAINLLHGGAASVALSIRTPPHILHRQIGRVPSDLLAVASRRLPAVLVDPLAHWLRLATRGYAPAQRLGRPPRGLKSHVQETGMIPTIDPGHFIQTVREGALPVVAGVARFDHDAALLDDGTELKPDVVIAATGYRTGLEPLVGHLGVLDENGYPTVHAPRSHMRTQNLFFVGFTHPLSGNLRELRLVGRRTGREVAQRTRA